MSTEKTPLLTVMTFGELCDRCDRERAELLKDGATRGRWTFRPDLLTLEYHGEHGHWAYEVDLERCQTCSQLLDWIAQLAGKLDDFIPDAELGAAVRLLNKVLEIQARYCSGGTDRGRVDVRRMLTPGEEQAAA